MKICRICWGREQLMRVVRALSIVFGLLMTATVVASAAPKAETQKKPAAGAGNATIYFLRPMPVAGWATKPDVKLDGRLIGEIRAGTYFVASAPRGQHIISIQGGGLDGGYDSNLQVEAGKTYFLEVGPNQS